MTPQQRAKRLIDDGIHMTLATTDVAGVPWVSPVFYVPDDAYDLYWTSWFSARHSENIRGNPQVAIAIYEAEPGQPVDAVYLRARDRAERSRWGQPRNRDYGAQIAA